MQECRVKVWQQWKKNNLLSATRARTSRLNQECWILGSSPGYEQNTSQLLSTPGLEPRIFKRAQHRPSYHQQTLSFVCNQVFNLLGGGGEEPGPEPRLEPRTHNLATKLPVALQPGHRANRPAGVFFFSIYSGWLQTVPCKTRASNTGTLESVCLQVKV